MHRVYTFVLTGTRRTVWGGYPPDDRRWRLRLLIPDAMPPRGTPDRTRYDETVEMRNFLLNAYNGCEVVSFYHAPYKYNEVRVADVTVSRVEEPKP